MKSGFSLVELSIVLVILGLLTGGILAGQSLIRASELRSVSNDYNRYVSAMHTFRDKYFALPGDMSNAVKFWGAADAGDGVGADCGDTTSTTATTCNGDGDGLIDARVAAGTTVDEIYRSWQHLANAGLIEGSYSGRAGTGGQWHTVIGTNAPRSKLNNAGYTMANAWVAVGNPDMFDYNYSTRLFFGTSVTNGATGNPAIATEEAWNIDTKMDDGRPAYGTVMTYRNGSATAGNCATTNVSATAAYALSVTGLQCVLIFNTGM